MDETPIEDAGEAEPAAQPTSGDGRPATIVRAGARPDADALLTELGLHRRRPVLVVCGGADTLTGDAYELTERVVGPAVARAASVARAAVVDGGTASGIMKIVGEAIRERADGVDLLGVAPAGCVTYGGAPHDTGTGVALDQNHSHFVLADSAEWGGETQLLVALSTGIAAGQPVVVVVAGGGTVTKREVLQAVRNGWPVFAIAKTGGTADEIVSAWRRLHEPQPRRLARVLGKRLASLLPRRWRWRTPPGELADRELHEIVRDGDVRFYSSRDPVDLARRLAWELQDAEVLKLAWKSFATYDALANSARRSFERIQAWILVGGVAATFLALLKASVDISPTSSASWIDDVLHWSVVVLPILVATLIGMAYRLGAGKRWVLLRGAAETIKREIYRFRTRTGAYAPGRGRAEEVLSKELEGIDRKLLQTEASSSELTPYAGPLPPDMYGSGRDDDGLSRLDAERYVALRVADQLNYYHPKVARLARTRRRFQLLALTAAGAGAIVAAAGAEAWLGLTTGIAAAAIAYLGYLQVESTLVAYNQAAGQLDALRRAWAARSEKRVDREDFDNLVTAAERALSTELGGWVDQMTHALDERQSERTDEVRRASGSIPVVQPPTSGAAQRQT